ncbi:hypothetical protein BE21_04390 [Sorangium cellulosum]|uniref:Uncharacterized protein n=1 Tax=Sorangium cellulosum TaxID=56 RepID=A0A150TGE0_SORCE|nr:hypothetical protein BE21_04390 [Sorangium cellulosum]
MKLRAWLRQRLGLDGNVTSHIEAGERGVVRRFSDGGAQDVPWEDCVQVSVVWIGRDDRLLSRDPWYLMLHRLDRRTCSVARHEALQHALLDLMERRLPGFDRREAEAVLERSDARRTVLWQRASIACPRCSAVLVDAAQQDGLPWDRYVSCPRCGFAVGIGNQRIPSG